MAHYTIEGGRQLCGTIHPGGNKNAALPCLAATLLSSETVTLRNIPRIRDVETLLEIMSLLGAEIRWAEANTVEINAAGVNSYRPDPELCGRIRASVLLAGPLLARFGEVVLPSPGGDVIGRRRLDTHVEGFKWLGATSEVESNGIRLKGDLSATSPSVFLDEPSVTGTENLVMACATLPGQVTLRNVASEPHVQDLCRLLVCMGASIRGIGSNTLIIEGSRELGGAEMRIAADHIEIGSFIGLASATRSDINIADVPMEHMHSTLLGFRRLGVSVEPVEDSLIVEGSKTPKVQKELFGHIPKIDDGPWPAFPADLTSIALVTATLSEGAIMIHEKMFESRMFFTDKLVGMGARIVLCDPHRALVMGPSHLRGATLESPDIRAGMSLLIAALAAEGESVIHNVQQIERGYADIDRRLNGLGASIERHA